MLAKSDGHFCQVLEGRVDAIKRVMAKINADRRHTEVRVLLQEVSNVRLFEAWSMGLVMRDDMATEMRQLHETGSAEGSTLEQVLERLMEPPGHWHGRSA